MLISAYGKKFQIDEVRTVDDELLVVVVSVSVVLAKLDTWRELDGSELKLK